MLVPFLVQTRFEQQSIFFLPSYSSSVFVPLNIVVSLNIVFWILYFDIIEYFHVICTNTAEGQAWKQASLCLPLDRSLWSTIKMYVINNMFVKQSWNKYWIELNWFHSSSETKLQWWNLLWKTNLRRPISGPKVGQCLELPEINTIPDKCHSASSASKRKVPPF